MDGVYFSASSTTGAKLGKITYRAKITENGRAMEALKGKLNTWEDLQKFVKSYWPGDLKGSPVRDYEIKLTLTIWKYMGGMGHGVMNVSMPRPFYINFTG